MRLIPQTPAFPQVAENRDSLDCFAEAHVVSKYAIHVVLVKRNHPLQTVKLVGLQLSILQAFGLPEEKIGFTPWVTDFVFLSF